MNPELMQDIQKRMNLLEKDQEEVRKLAASFKIDRQLFLQTPTRITPGIASKVAFNAYGLIVGTDKLTQSDLPDIDINKVKGLKKSLDEKASVDDVKNIEKRLSDVFSKGASVKSGCKTNIDAKGLVVSVSDLLAEDIPELPISKITGLQNIIDQLRSSENKRELTDDHHSINPGSACKVDWDEHGHITGYHQLSIDDIPADLLSRLNVLEEKSGNFVQQKVISNLIKQVLGKLDANAPIQPGTYTKVVVGTDGLVRFGSQLERSDIPDLGIDDITDLRKSINCKADRTELTDINTTMESLINMLNRVGDVNKLRSSVDGKADRESVLQLRTQVNELKKLLEELLNSIPGDKIMEELEKINKELSDISGRVSTLENSSS